MSLARRLPVMASISYVILFAALAQQEVIGADRTLIGQAAPAGKGLPLSPDPVAPAATVAGAVPEKPVSSRIGIT